MRGDRLYLASATPSILGPTEEALRIVAGLQGTGGDPRRETTSAVDVASLAPAPASVVASGDTSGSFDPAIALAQGIGYNHKGLHVEASRVLNDGLSRLPADAPASVRAELLLEAGLANSNIRSRKPRRNISRERMRSWRRTRTRGRRSCSASAMPM